jgi:hypothetical protein
MWHENLGSGAAELDISRGTEMTWKQRSSGAPLDCITATTPGHYARRLLATLSRDTLALPVPDGRDADALWAESGAMWLTGHANDQGRPCAAPIAVAAQGAWLAFAALQPDRLNPTFEAFKLLGERAAIAGLTRRGRTSAGGACHLLQARDGFVALNLARESDFELLPAWLECSDSGGDALLDAVGARPMRKLVSRARLIGLAAAPVEQPRGGAGAWYRGYRIAPPARSGDRPPMVVDLGALWAAPLCAQLLQEVGSRVIKVESSARPDGARAGPSHFFDLMNAGKESVALDLRTATGRSALNDLLIAADIVIESSRPRALEQMGIFAARILGARPGKVWISISGYGRRAPMRHWAAFGDDAGVAAGLSWLVGENGRDPVFCGDAIADPLTGLHAALLGWSEWQSGGGRLLDISLCGVARYAVSTGFPCAAPGARGFEPKAPAARMPKNRAASLGADTSRVLRELARRSA